MSTEQKLREALQALLASGEEIAEATDDELQAAIDDPDAEEIVKVQAAAFLNARQALATTAPEPTGMPELPEPDHKADRWPTSHVYTADQMREYGEQCWKAGYKHGAWADKPEPTGKQSLQVEPAVNQQLTTEPIDEREAFEKWITKNGEWPNNAMRSCLDPDRYANFDIQGLWGAWQARAAMAKGVDGLATAPNKENGWLPIETAPKDGTRILVATELSKHPVISWWIGDGFLAGQDNFGPRTWTTYGSSALKWWTPLLPVPAEMAKGVK